jgi:AcrR family transcriptional regulator
MIEQPEKSPRRPDAERTKLDIMRVAITEFAENGLAGARVDAIAANTQSTKRMIYYYFGSKEGLYLTVLENAYRDIRGSETDLELHRVAPAEAMRRLVEASIDNHDHNPDFVRLVCSENIHHGRYIKQLPTIRALNVTVIDALRDIVTRGREMGVFTRDVDILDLHLLISAISFYRVGNRHTFGTLFDIDLAATDVTERHKKLLVDAVFGVLGYTAPGGRV